MDEPLDNLESADAELENQLLAAPLRRPSAMLDARVRQTIRRHQTRPRRRLAFGLAAMIVIASSIVLTHYRYRQYTGLPPGTAPRHTEGLAALSPMPNARAASPSAAPAPVAAARSLRIVRTLSSLADDGVVATIGGCPIQRLRQVQVEQVVVFDPTRGCSVVYRRPRERVVLVAAKAF